MSANEKPIADLNAEIKNKESKNKRTKVVPCTSLGKINNTLYIYFYELFIPPIKSSYILD